MNHKPQYYIIGPFQFLLFSLSISEFLLILWMSHEGIESPERIVVGALSIAVLIAVLVIFCVIYWIKKTRGDFDEWKKNTLRSP